MTLAPISLTVYDRLEHLQNCITSLTDNPLSKDSILYVFSDGAKIGDEEKIEAVRKYIDTITSFKEVIKVFQPDNNYQRNIDMSINVPLKNHSKLIFIEDDVVVSKKFLEFMNDGLDFYEDSQQVFMISGYADPINESPNQSEVKAFQCMCATGFGFWEHKYNEFLKDYSMMHPYLRINKNIFTLLKFIFQHKIADYFVLQHIFQKNLIYYDLVIGEYMQRKKLLSVFPPITQALNKGYDGSGAHCGIEERFSKQTIKNSTSKFSFKNDFKREQIKMETALYKSKRKSFFSEIIALLRLTKSKFS